MKTDCAIIGFEDNVALFLDLNISKYTNFYNKFFICYEQSPKKYFQNLKIKTSKNTEYVTNKKLGNKKIHYSKKIISILKKNKIKNVFIGFSDNEVREEVYKKLNKSNIKVNSFIHPTAILAGENKIGAGSIIYGNTYIGYKVKIDNCVIVQSSVTIEHHSLVKSFSNISPGVVTGGYVKIGKNCNIGIASTLINNVQIPNNSVIGAKSLILKSIKYKNKVIYGIPGKIHEKKKKLVLLA